MTGPQLAKLPGDLLTTAGAITCPHCGTSAARCRVWAGGIGHSLGMHEERLAQAQLNVDRLQHRRSARTDFVTGEVTATATSSRHHHHQPSAA